MARLLLGQHSPTLHQPIKYVQVQVLSDYPVMSQCGPGNRGNKWTARASSIPVPLTLMAPEGQNSSLLDPFMSCGAFMYPQMQKGNLSASTKPCLWVLLMIIQDQVIQQLTTKSACEVFILMRGPSHRGGVRGVRHNLYCPPQRLTGVEVLRAAYSWSPPQNG